MSASKALAARSLHIAKYTVAEISEALDISESSVRKYLANEREPDTAFTSLIENFEKTAAAALDETDKMLVKCGEKPLDLTPRQEDSSLPAGYTKEQLGADLTRAIGEYILNANRRAKGL